jgi:ABC-type sugar transport system substrate-binding protein
MFKQTVAANCSKCTVTDFKENFADVAAGKAPAAIVSELQRHPNVKYVISAEQALADSVPQAVSSAGITGVKFAGASAEKTEEAMVQSGQISAVVPTSLNFAAWRVVDAAIRHEEGMPQKTNIPLNQMLYTKGTTVPPSDSFNEPANWQDQFKKLWKVG